MKMYGKVIFYDGYFGKIIGEDNQEYLILKRNVIDNLKENDYVVFEGNIFKDCELSKNIARFITVIKQ